MDAAKGRKGLEVLLGSGRASSRECPDCSEPVGIGCNRGDELSLELPVDALADEAALAGVAGAFGAAIVTGFSTAEHRLLEASTRPPEALLDSVAACIRSGKDPLGEAFCRIRSAAVRRETGAIYTPQPIIDGMLSWALARGTPGRIVDAGSGSGRFLMASGRKFPRAHLLAIECDPLAALVSRANLAVSGMADRSEVRVENFLNSQLTEFSGRTLFVGNPPYVRHHRIPAEWKNWLKTEAKALGVRATALAGLHAYFVLAIAKAGRPGDFGALITSAEWLDVNYGKLVRDLFLDRLGGRGVFLVEPDAEPFPGTATTAAIATFEFGSLATTASFSRGCRFTAADLTSGRTVVREQLASQSRWSDFTRTLPKAPQGFVELGELCRVHRGQVTGANRIWIAGDHSEGLPLEVLFRSVTKASELLECGKSLADAAVLRNVIDLPADLSVLGKLRRAAVERFLILAERMGARDSYVAKHRVPWWSVRLREPAPVLATYMARRPPAFVMNEVSARHLNIAHGLYPRQTLSESQLASLVKWLRQATFLPGGRVYSGGLVKYEPGEMERIMVPPLSSLSNYVKPSAMG